VNKKAKNQIQKNLDGVKELIISAIAFSLMTVCVKNLQGRLPVSELIFSRALISLIITRFMLFKQNISPWGINRKLLFIRGVLGTGALFCIFKALEILPLASATILQYSYPTFTSIAAWIFLKEFLNKSVGLALLLGWIGIILVVQPQWIFNNGKELPLEGVVIALIGAILTALAYICVRKLSSIDHPLVIIHYFPLISIPIAIPDLIKSAVMPVGAEWLWLIGIGIFTQIGQLGVTKGLTLLPAARASSINYSQVFFATIWGIIFFSEPFNEYVSLGALFIFSATLLSVKAKQKVI
tara:strand:- start:32002 stop:32892 length:891 start_codon:yes stop_codon:yes gene_type:complete